MIDKSIHYHLEPASSSAEGSVARWLPSPNTAEGEKLAYEIFVLNYTPIWIGIFAIIIIGQLYERFDAVSTHSFNQEDDG